MKHYYTEKELKELLDHLVILHDSREQSSSHILDYFDKHKIKHKKKALKTGDYAFMITKCPELGFPRDMYFTDELCIERKNSVSEIAGNLVEKDDRFIKELNRMIAIENVYILIENDRFDDIIEHNYQSKYNELAFLRTLLSVQKRSGFFMDFIKKENMGFVIYEICRSCLMDKVLK